MKVIAISALVFVSSLVAIGCQPSTTVGPQSESDGRVSEQVNAPCTGAELHTVQTYSVCNGGHVDQYEQETWCCPDGTKPTTNSLLDATGTSCGPSPTIAAPTSCTSSAVFSLSKCTESDRTDAARKCDNAGCHYSIEYGDPTGCVVKCTP
jgi:hypothetical protein